MRVGRGEDACRQRPDEQCEDDEPAPVDADLDAGDPAEAKARSHPGYRLPAGQVGNPMHPRRVWLRAGRVALSIMSRRVRAVIMAAVALPVLSASGCGGGHKTSASSAKAQ